MDKFVNSIKTSIMGGFASINITLITAAVCFFWALTISLYIFALYKSIKKDSFYQKGYGLSLVALAVIVSSIILVIQSNIVISLGMVGALSIVRYRTAVKDPMDLMFLFWTISIGLICGAGFAGIAILSSAIMTVLILVFDRTAVYIAPKVLVINGSDCELDSKIEICLKKYCDYFCIKAHNLRAGHIDMAIEVKSKRETEMLAALMNLERVDSASLVAHNGDVTI